MINKYDKGAVVTDVNSTSDRLLCYFSSCLLKQEFLDIYLSMFSTVCNFRSI